MICPKCKEEGKRSTVSVRGASKTLMYCEPFYDEDGKLHSHDCNRVTEHFSCSSGHIITKTSRGSCWCGWTGGPEKIEVRDRPTGPLRPAGNGGIEWNIK